MFILTGQAFQFTINTLGRLYFAEGPWDAKWWGTHPDTTGPYFGPVEWSETKKITDVLSGSLKNPSDAKAIVGMISKYKIEIPGAVPAIA